MNIDWINFLKSHTVATTSELMPQLQNNNTDSISAPTHLAIIKITGADASQFLQGQLTCNINELSQSNGYFTAFCNAKGRVISTLLIIKVKETYLIVLPKELAAKVCNKLGLYILRSDVQLIDISDQFCVIGLITNNPELIPNLPTTDFAVSNQSTIIIKIPGAPNRYLMINSVLEAQSNWTLLVNKACAFSHEDIWKYHDISSGMAWLTNDSSEQYIPQMLNIDKLGGISFNKGCYTGQEIVARTHYLGKTKRELFLAEYNFTAMLDDNIQIISNRNDQSIGKVLNSQSDGKKTRLLIVIPTSDAELSDLKLDNVDQTKISIIEYQ